MLCYNLVLVDATKTREYFSLKNQKISDFIIPFPRIAAVYSELVSACCKHIDTIIIIVLTCYRELFFFYMFTQIRVNK